MFKSIMSAFVTMFALFSSFFSGSTTQRAGFVNAKALAVVIAVTALFATQASAALVVDTVAIMSDITTAGVAGLAIALAVAGIAIGVNLVRKLIRA